MFNSLNSFDDVARMVQAEARDGLSKASALAYEMAAKERAHVRSRVQSSGGRRLVVRSSPHARSMKWSTSSLAAVCSAAIAAYVARG